MRDFLGTDKDVPNIKKNDSQYRNLDIPID